MVERFEGVKPTEGPVAYPTPPSVDLINDLRDEYRLAAQAGRLPTAEEQNELVAGVQQQDALAARRLIRTHRGLVADVASAFRSDKNGDAELLTQGATALVWAAEHHDLNGEENFSNYAAEVIYAALDQAHPIGNKTIMAYKRLRTEMGQFVGRLADGTPDYSSIVGWARALSPAADRDLPGAVDVIPININGRKATVGWLSLANPEQTTLGPRTVENRGGERMVIVEGGLTARVAKPDNPERWESISVRAEADFPARHERLSFAQNDIVVLEKPEGPYFECWYVCFYPETKN